MDILDIESAKEYGPKILLWFKHLQFGNKSQLAFLEDFYLLVNDGIPPNRAIDMMAQVSEGITRDVALSIARKISEGQALADGMQGWFNYNIVEVIRVGEEGGALSETIRSAINSTSEQSGMLRAFFAAITYPIFVIIMACSIIVYLNDSVFNQFRQLKPMNQWPDAGRQLVDVANTIVSWWWAVILIVITLVLFFRRVMKNYTGELRPMLDVIPPFNLYRRVVAARFMETLGLLVANGVVFKHALKVMQFQATPYLNVHLMMMERLLSAGKGNIADVLETGLISNQDILRLRIMAEVKGFEHGLVRMGVHGTESMGKTMKIISKFIGGILLAIGGMLIILIIRGIYLTAMTMGAG